MSGDDGGFGGGRCHNGDGSDDDHGGGHSDVLM